MTIITICCNTTFLQESLKTFATNNESLTVDVKFKYSEVSRAFVEIIKKKENLRSLPKPIKLDVKYDK